MSSHESADLESQIKNEIDFARAVTALMMAVKLDVSDTQAHRAKIKLDSNYARFEADVEKRAS